MAQLSHPIAPGTVLLEKYRIEKLIGQGGMAAVYLAHHEILQQDVAIKLLLPEVAAMPEAATRFLNEARAAVRLRNEHVAAVMDVGVVDDGAAFIVLEYLEGRDLEAMLEAQGPLPWQLVVDYVLQALEAVGQAHALGIVHRDLKPSNLFVTKRPDGSEIVKVLDFGISKITGAQADIAVTSTKTMLGSPAFMSPEQLRSAKKVDARTDVWAVGVIFYHLITGAYPFQAETMGELFAAVLEQKPAPIRANSADVPPELEAVYAKCLERNVDGRYANVAELAMALQPLASPEGALSVPRICKMLGAGRASAPAITKPREISAGVVTKPSEPAAISMAVESTLARPTGQNTEGAWSESFATPKRSSLSLVFGIGAIALCAIGATAFAVWPRSKGQASSAGVDAAAGLAASQGLPGLSESPSLTTEPRTPERSEGTRFEPTTRATTSAAASVSVPAAVALRPAASQSTVAASTATPASTRTSHGKHDHVAAPKASEAPKTSPPPDPNLLLLQRN